MILWELLIGFLKVGCFSFGGAYAAIPLIRDIVFSYGWLNEEMLTYMIAVSESTPGPIMVNLATYVGASQAGLAGSLIATLAVVLPSFVIILLITSLLPRVIKNAYVQAALRGAKPCIAGIILATGLFMTARTLSDDFSGRSEGRTCALAIVLAAAYFGLRRLKLCASGRVKRLKGGLSPIGLIALSAVLGIVFYGI